MLQTGLTWSEVPLLIGFGIIDGAILAVAALGFTLQLGVTNVVNFAYGEFITFGALGGVLINRLGIQTNFWETVLVGGVSGALLSFVIGQYLYAPFFKRRPEILYTLVLTFGVSLILVNVFLAILGSQFQQLKPSAYPPGSADVHEIGPFIVTTLQLWFLVLSIVGLLVAHALLNFTRLGKSMRAISDNRALATVCGLNINRITSYTWLMTGFLAGSAGVVQALQTRSFQPNLGDTFVYLVFAAVVMGGIGRPLGAVLGAVIIGLVAQLGVAVVGAADSPAIIFVVLVALMLFRPSGIFGSTGRSAFA